MTTETEQEKKRIGDLRRKVDNTVILGTTVQYGLEILRQLQDTGSLGVSATVGGQPLTRTGLATLLVADIAKQVVENAKQTGVEK